MEITEFQYPDGWYMRVGQVYSSPYEPYRVRITRIEVEGIEFAENFWIHFEKLNPKNYIEVWSSENDEDRGKAWWFNEGYWDLEKEPEQNIAIDGRTRTIHFSTDGTTPKEYLFGINLTQGNDRTDSR